MDIYQGLPKSDKMELIIQKSVELGANSIIPVNMKRCVVKLEGKDEIKKNERWQKIAESAAKQCGRGFIPEVKHLINVKEICNWINEYDVIIVAYENEKENFHDGAGHIPADRPASHRSLGSDHQRQKLFRCDRQTLGQAADHADELPRCHQRL